MSSWFVGVCSFETTNCDTLDTERTNVKHVHLKRIKKAESGDPAEDEWKETSTLGKKIEFQDVMDVPNRAITFEKDGRKNFEKYVQKSPKIKDEIKNTTQYIKLVNAHVAEKKLKFKKFKEENEKFDQQIASLKPRSQRHKFDLDKLNFKEIKVVKLKEELEFLKTEREETKLKINHLANQLRQAQSELNFKVEQIEDIQQELQRLEKKEILQNKVENEEDALRIIKRELNYIGNVDQSRRIFGAVNSLANLLQSKNQSTLNELNAVKAEFNELKQKYNELMNKLR